MTGHEIANLFGVFVSAVGANIRSIFKKRDFGRTPCAPRGQAS
jgi:hypothetical protein